MSSNLAYLPNANKQSDDVLKYNRLNNWPDLPAQAQLFVHKYIDEGIVAACKHLSITKSAGLRILRDRLVNAYFKHIEDTLVSATLINQSFVELNLLETLEQANGEVDIPHVTKDGDVVMAPSVNLTAKVQVLRDMQKLAGMDKGVDKGLTSIKIDMDAFTGKSQVEIKGA